MIRWILVGILFKLSLGRQDIWLNIPCNKHFKPDNCDICKTRFSSLEELDRCGPAILTVKARNYFLGRSGRGITYKDNKDAFDRIRIQPKMLRDVSNISIETSILKGDRVDLPIGLAPVALHKLASEDGELDTVRGLSNTRTVMILSSYASSRVEQVAREAGGQTILWQQVYIFLNRSHTVDLVRRAEENGVQALVLTSDSPSDATLSCNSRNDVEIDDHIQNSLNVASWTATTHDPSITFSQITWLKSITKLPIVAKGILTGRDALRAVKAGASAIIVSNHGGRQMDGTPATIDALPGVVRALRGLFPPIDVYLDGGVRSGHDVFKAIARGAKVVFLGRPQIWALAVGGSKGVGKMMSILKEQFKEVMVLAGASNVASIGPDFLVNSKDVFETAYLGASEDLYNPLEGVLCSPGSEDPNCFQ